jgi:hypothetical protein
VVEETRAEFHEEEEDQGDDEANLTIIPIPVPVPADGTKRTPDPAIEPVEGPKHSTDTATNPVVIAYHLSDVIHPRNFKSLKEHQIPDRSEELDVVVWKHKWRWKNAEVELIQQTEPPRHVEDGQEVDEGRLSSSLLTLDRPILLV